MDNEWVLWKSPHPGFVWIHRLRTEDEVYDYNFTTSWEFPDRSLDGKVILAIRTIENTNFVSEISGYWDKWVL